jgi:hypothetical protein
LGRLRNYVAASILPVRVENPHKGIVCRNYNASVDVLRLPFFVFLKYANFSLAQLDVFCHKLIIELNFLFVKSFLKLFGQVSLLPYMVPAKQPARSIIASL